MKNLRISTLMVIAILILYSPLLSAQEKKNDSLMMESDNKDLIPRIGISVGIGGEPGKYSNLELDFLFLTGRAEFCFRINASINVDNKTQGKAMPELSWGSSPEGIVSKGYFQSTLNLGYGFIGHGFYYFIFAGIAQTSYYRNTYDKEEKLGDSGKYYLVKNDAPHFNLSTELGYAFDNVFIGIGGGITDINEISLKIGYFLH